jgi:hypothetical protein
MSMSELQDRLRTYAQFVDGQHRELDVESIISDPSAGARSLRVRAPRPRLPLRHPVGVAVLVAAVVLVGVVAVMARRHESGAPLQTGPASMSTVPDGTRLLYTHTSPDGSTVTAYVGTVTLPSDPTCTTTSPNNAVTCDPGPGQSTSGPGIEFDYVIDGQSYRSIVLDSDPRLAPSSGGGGMVPLFGSPDPTTSTPRNLIILHVETQVAQVHLAPSGPGGASPDGDQMTPVEGWVTFPIHNLDRLANPEALDRNGTTLGTTLPFPCC